ncbi:6-pyruvoyl trahydropterin synthase family protein [Halorubrum tibetense]|uniref:6-pyruvoyl tetrahydropterin synthase family protein n=1 Tax=Halorubrum tibetense TaxID=175631 RepID=A0ABD5SHH1_9EURY
MYTVSVSRACIAQHYLTVPDPGPEGTLHSHRFDVEVSFRGSTLNEYGYLVDIDAVIDALETVVDGIRDRTLNDMPAFEGLNPSAERLAEHVGDRLLDRLDPETATELAVRVREDDVAEVVHERPI